MVKFVSQIALGIDLGTSNTLVYLKKYGVVWEEPSVIAFNKKDQSIVAIGKEAKKMIGRTPQNLIVVQPIQLGILTDFEAAQAFLTRILSDIRKKYLYLFRPVAVIGTPLNLTEVQQRGIIDAAKASGFKTVNLVEEPITAALGGNLDIEEAKGLMLVDIGGGTTEIAVLSLGGIVVGKSIKIAGDRFNREIVNYVRLKHNLIIGESQAEEVKINIGNIFSRESTYMLRGRDAITTLPREVIFHGLDLRDCLLPNFLEIVDEIKDIINLTPPDLLGDIISRGIYLTGGGSLLSGLAELFEKELKIKITPLEDPFYSVVKGLGRIVEDFDYYCKFIIRDERLR
jgi:rod shape-determining protein MreB